MAQFKKGDPKPQNSGRQKGTKNKDHAEIRKLLLKLVDDNWADVERDFKAMGSEAKLKYILRIAELTLPKLSTIDASVATGPVKIIVKDGSTYGCV